MKLNTAEATALIASQVLEFIRDGKSVAELMDLGRQFLGRKQVIAGVESMLVEIQVEGTFPDGTKLVTVHDPISQENGNMKVRVGSGPLPRCFAAARGCTIIIFIVLKSCAHRLQLLAFSLHLPLSVGVTPHLDTPLFC